VGAHRDAYSARALNRLCLAGTLSVIAKFKRVSRIAVLMLGAYVHTFIVQCFVLATLMFSTLLWSARSESSFVLSFFR
jgi:hypothetical protein